MKKVPVLTIALALALLVAACKKTPPPAGEEPIPIPSACELCAYADELEGTYKGWAMGQEVLHQTDTAWSDTLRVTVEHIYQNLGTYEDSTVMFLRLYWKYNLKSDTSVGIVKMFSPTGFNFFDNTSYSPYNQFKLTPEEMRINFFALSFAGVRE